MDIFSPTPTATPTEASNSIFASIFIQKTPISSPTPTIDKPILFYGWFSEEQQRHRVLYPTKHMFKGKTIISPPYTYYLQGNKKVLVTEITHSPEPTQQQIKNGDICIGLVDNYYRRSYDQIM